MDLINSHFVCTVITAALGSGFQHGYHTGVINVPYEIIQNFVNQTTHDRTGVYLTDTSLATMWSVTTSLMNIGGAIGGMLTKVTCTAFGPKGSLVLNNFLALLACVLMGLAKWLGSFEMLMIGRFVIGVNCGLNAGICPMYLSEISPQRLRGAVATLYQLVITISILISQVIGVKEILGTEPLWPILFLLPIAVAGCQATFLLFCAESPKHLISVKADDAKAEQALKFLRKQDDVTAELSSIKAEDQAVKAMPKVTIRDMFGARMLRRPLCIAVGCMVGQQLSGINAVMFYSTQTFENSGLSKNEALIGTLSMSTVNVLMTIVSVFMVEIMGRKTLLLIGFGGMTIDTVLMGISLYFAKKEHLAAYFSVAFIILYIMVFAPGPGPIPWFLISEIFNQAARSTAASIATPTNWITNFIVTLVFPPLERAIGSFVFFIFAILNALFFIFVLLKVPETKNRSIEEVTKLFE